MTKDREISQFTGIPLKDVREIRLKRRLPCEYEKFKLGIYERAAKTKEYQARLARGDAMFWIDFDMHNHHLVKPTAEMVKFVRSRKFHIESQRPYYVYVFDKSENILGERGPLFKRNDIIQAINELDDSVDYFFTMLLAYTINTVHCYDDNIVVVKDIDGYYQYEGR